MGSLLMASPARAEYSLLHAERNDNGVVLLCSPTNECAGAGTDDCGGLQCASVNQDVSICIDSTRQLRFEVFCCDTVEDCPSRDNANARSCSHVAGDVSVCLWAGSVPRVYNFCTTANSSATFEGVAACFAGTGTGALTLAQGDCDGDGESNATDATVCTPNIIPPGDMGVDPIDFGVDDGGFDFDGSTTPIDHGSTVDSGSTANPTAPFQGGGGCSVGGAEAPSGALLLVLGALLVGRRRRSR